MSQRVNTSDIRKQKLGMVEKKKKLKDDEDDGRCLDWLARRARVGW